MQQIKNNNRENHHQQQQQQEEVETERGGLFSRAAYG